MQPTVARVQLKSLRVVRGGTVKMALGLGNLALEEVDLRKLLVGRRDESFKCLAGT